jgi:hypothetical protein
LALIRCAGWAGDVPIRRPKATGSAARGHAAASALAPIAHWATDCNGQLRLAALAGSLVRATDRAGPLAWQPAAARVLGIVKEPNGLAVRSRE